MRRLGVFVVVLCLTIVVLGCSGPAATNASRAENEAKLKQALSYLNDIPEVEWVKYEDNTVRIGVNRLPVDIGMVASAAAVIGNRAIDFGVHVWVHPADNPVKYYGQVTARHGKVTDAYGK